MHLKLQDIRKGKEHVINMLLPLNNQVISVELDDKTKLKMKARYAILNMFFWELCVKWNLPITKDLLMEAGIVSMSSISKLLTKVLNHCIQHFDNHGITNKDPLNIQFDMFWLINDLYNFIVEECQEYHGTVDIFGLSELYESEQITKLRDSLTFDENTPSGVIEQQMTSATKKMLEVLKTDFKGNALYDLHRLGFLNKLQLPQLLLAIGSRTDVNEYLIRYPIRGNFVGGLRNTFEYMIESLTAKKAAFYTKSSISMSQYFARKSHLISSMIRHAYPGDCGSTVHLPVQVTKDLVENLEGKYHLVNGQLVEITKNDFNSLVGKIINIRSPLTCKHTDGSCEACGGSMLKYFIKGANIGIGATIKFTNPVTQKIMSFKHAQNTKSIIYIPPQSARKYLTHKDESTYFRPTLKKDLKNIVLHVGKEWTKLLSDLPLIESLDFINIEHFSTIPDIVLQNTKNGNVSNIINLVNGQAIPYFSKDMLQYIKDNYKRLIVTDTSVGIPLDKFDIGRPVFKAMIFNDSMITFVSNVEKLFKSGIRKYTSIPDVVHDVSNLIYSKVSANFLNFELLLKSYLITSELDYSVPVVTDVTNVQFGDNASIIQNRSAGTFMAFENHPKGMRNPRTYLIPKEVGPFDNFLGQLPMK